MSQKTYRIGEAATKMKLKSYVLRFWETEFPQIAPIRTEKGQRLYTESDLAVLGRIRYLLHERGLTIDGARRLLREEAAKGALYTEASMPSDENLANENLADDYPDAPLESAHGDIPATDGNALPGKTADGASGSAAHLSVQASLFPAAEAAASPAASTGSSPGASPIIPVPTNELRAIITELAALRRLLDTATPGE